MNYMGLLLILVLLSKTIYLVQLLLQKMMILINTNILDMVLDLIQKEVFHIQAEELVEMLIFLGLI